MTRTLINRQADAAAIALLAAAFAFALVRSS